MDWTGADVISRAYRRKDPCSGGPWKALRVIVDHAKAHAPGEFGPGAQNSLGKFGPCTGPELESELHELSERGRTDSHQTFVRASPTASGMSRPLSTTRDACASVQDAMWGLLFSEDKVQSERWRGRLAGGRRNTREMFCQKGLQRREHMLGASG